MTKPIYRTPTMKEELRAWRDLAHELHMHRCITMNEPEVIKILDRMQAWSSAHSDGNGEWSDNQIENNINTAFWEKIVYPGMQVLGYKPVPAKKSKAQL